MKLPGKHIGIVGGGPGGLMLARLLSLKGASVKVFERDTNKDARVSGSPLDMHHHSGLAALEKGGLLPAFKKAYRPGADKLTVANSAAEILLDERGEETREAFGEPHFRPEIDRPALRKLLLESLEPGIVVWDSYFLTMEKEGEGWRLFFKNGDTAYADIVVAADGANSKIRPYLTPTKPFYSGITMLEGSVYDGSAAPFFDVLLQGGKCMAFGKGENMLLGQKGSGEIGFYASFKAPENWAQISGLSFSDKTALLTWFRSAYADWNPVWEQLIEGATMPLVPRPIMCAPLNQNWESGPNLTLIGDAAHVMPPFAGEGANMAMRDALELSEYLFSNDYGMVREAIAAYEKEMRARAAAAAKESLQNGERMHAEDALETMLGFFAGGE